MATSITLTTNKASTNYTLSTGARGPAGPAGEGAELTSYATQVAALDDYPTTFPPTIGSASNQAVAGNDARVVNAVQSVVTGITGADAITNIVSLTEAEYTAATKNASTLYVVTPNP
jgi:hypothetical protein